MNAAIANSLPLLAQDGVRITALGSIGEFPHYNGEIEAAGLLAPVASMAATISAADGLIIVARKHKYSIAGVLTNAHDWLSHLPAKPLAGKPVLVQTASPRAIGGARAQYHLRQILVALDAAVMKQA